MSALDDGIRNPRRPNAKVHRPVERNALPGDWGPRWISTACDKWRDADIYGLTQRTVIAAVPRADLCRRCWPEDAV